MMYARLFKILLAVVFISHYSYAQERLAGLDEKKDLPILNDELKRLDRKIENHNHDTLYLNRTNTTAYTPTTTHHPATKGYVDGVAGGSQGIKAWAFVTYSSGTPTLQDSYNVSGITDTDTGKLTVTWGTDFSNNNYAVVATVYEAKASNELFCEIDTKAVGSVILAIITSGGASQDPSDGHGVSVMAIGDQ